MNCGEAESLVGAQVDGELDPLRAHALKLHLAGCERCAAALQAVQDLRGQLRAALPRHAAPPELRERVRATLAVAQVAGEPRAALRAQRRRWLSVGALAGCCATVLAWLVAGALLDWRARDDLAQEAVDGHVRATLAKHLVDVASSDQHTVKPWLSSRLDYAPPVKDLREAGFPLVGARIDYLDRRPVAILVYRYREHVIDVMVRPQVAHAGPAGPRTVRGFNLAPALGQGMEWYAVSDMQPDGLTRFVQLLANDPPAPDAK